MKTTKEHQQQMVAAAMMINDYIDKINEETDKIEDAALDRRDIDTITFVRSEFISLRFRIDDFIARINNEM